ncbi:MAG: PP2C family protein-serine/threonine phosphatase [Planctomycetota bacterium]
MRIRQDLEVAFGTVKGPVRPDNQDDFLVYEPSSFERLRREGRLMAVADGMGGEAGGGEASRVALRALLAGYLRVSEGEEAEFGEAFPVDQRLRMAFRSSCHAVARAARENRDLKNMGTTLTAVVISRGRLHGVHAGDSGCLLVRDGRLVWLSSMHSSPTSQHALTRAVGAGKDEEEPEQFEEELSTGDRLLLLTDGFWRVFDEDEILAAVGELDAREIVENLLSEAVSRNCTDNSTVILVCYREPEDRALKAALVEPVATGRVTQSRILLAENRVWPRLWPWLMLGMGLLLAGMAWMAKAGWIR